MVFPASIIWRATACPAKASDSHAAKRFHALDVANPRLNKTIPAAIGRQYPPRRNPSASRKRWSTCAHVMKAMAKSQQKIFRPLDQSISLDERDDVDGARLSIT